MRFDLVINLFVAQAIQEGEITMGQGEYLVFNPQNKNPVSRETFEKVFKPCPGDPQGDPYGWCELAQYFKEVLGNTCGRHLVLPGSTCKYP